MLRGVFVAVDGLGLGLGLILGLGLGLGLTRGLGLGLGTGEQTRQQMPSTQSAHQHQILENTVAGYAIATEAGATKACRQNMITTRLRLPRVGQLAFAIY
jgi:hypothetical protein